MELEHISTGVSLGNINSKFGAEIPKALPPAGYIGDGGLGYTIGKGGNLDFREGEWYHEYATNNKETMKAGETMSILVTGVTKNGVVIASDTRSVKPLPNGQFMVITDDFEKTFSNEDMIVGTWGANTVCGSGVEMRIGEMVESVLDEHPSGIADVMTIIADYHASGRYEFIGDTYFIICDKRESDKKLYELSAIGGIVALNVVIPGVNGIRTYGTNGLIPNYVDMDYSIPFDKFAEKIGSIVETAIEYGRALEKRGIVKNYHIGGKADVKTLLF